MIEDQSIENIIDYLKGERPERMQIKGSVYVEGYCDGLNEAIEELEVLVEKD